MVTGQGNTAAAAAGLLSIAVVVLVLSGASGCRPVQVDPDHLVEVDAMVATRTASSINSADLLRANLGIAVEPPTGILTVRTAVDRTLSHNLSLIASAETLPIAQAQLAQAGLYANPTIGQTGAFAFPLYSHGGATAFDILVTQTINTFITKPWKVAVAQAQRSQAGIDLASQAFDLAQQAEAKYQEMVHLVRDRRLSEKVAESYKRAFEAAQARAKVGMVPQPDVNRARLQYLDALRQMKHLQTQYQRAAREMNWLMGALGEPQWRLPDDQLEPPRALPRLPPPSSLEQLGRLYRLDLLRAEFDVKVGEANVKVARLGMIPNATIGVDAARDNAKHWTLGPAFSLELPIFDPGLVGVALAEAQLRLAHKSRAALDGQVQADVRTAFDNLTISDEDVRFYRDELIPQEEENVQLAEKSFRLGNTDLDNLLNTLREYVTVLQSYEDAIDTYHANRIALQRATGLVWERIAQETGVSGPATTQPASLPAATVPATQPVLR
jgi:cobalt-zinc-cadmium efflux system outer membrane protein